MQPRGTPLGDSDRPVRDIIARAQLAQSRRLHYRDAATRYDPSDMKGDDMTLADDWRSAGSSGEHLPAKWETFTEATLELLRAGEDPYAIVHHACEAIEHWYETEAFA